MEIELLNPSLPGKYKYFGSQSLKILFSFGELPRCCKEIHEADQQRQAQCFFPEVGNNSHTKPTNQQKRRKKQVHFGGGRWDALANLAATFLDIYSVRLLASLCVIWFRSPEFRSALWLGRDIFQSEN